MPVEFEYAYCKSLISALTKPRIPVAPYIPSRFQAPNRQLDVTSAWAGLENVLADIIDRFQLGTDRCIEFGVEKGFSTAALSSYFASVVGVDTFQGDRHTTIIKDIFAETTASLQPYDNIQLIRSDYRDFIKTTDQGIRYDLAHVDIIHTFADTYACGLWCAERSECSIFHDTESFPTVKQAVREIARTTGKKVYNFEKFYGLGIIV
jgi:hypothetical protein